MALPEVLIIGGGVAGLAGRFVVIAARDVSCGGGLAG